MLERLQALLDNQQDATPRETLEAVTAVFTEVDKRLTALEAPQASKTTAPATA